MPLAPSAISDFGFRISDFPSTLWTFRIWDFGFGIYRPPPQPPAGSDFGFRISDLTAVLCGKDCFDVSGEKGGAGRAGRVVPC